MRIYPRGKRGILWVDATIAGERLTRSTGTTSRAAAEEWAATLAHDTWRTRKLGETPAVSWGGAVLDWVDKYGDERRSIETMKDRLRWITDRIATLPLAQITTAKVDALFKEKRAEGASTATCNRMVSEISKILHHAHRQGWLIGVPALRRAAESKGMVRWITHAEARALLAELPPHLADMARMALATGLRESNVRLLRWDQLDLDRKVGWIEGADMKTGKALNVPLNADALEALQRRRGDHARYVFVWRPPAKKGSDTRPAAHTVTCCSTKAWHKATKRAGLSGLRWHDLRHTWASWHVQNGTPLPVLQQLGGWASYSMVLRYAHLGSDHVAMYADGSLIGIDLEGGSMDLTLLNAKHFWSKVLKRSAAECWPWIGCTKDRDGYGLYQENKRRFRANRVAFALHHVRNIASSEIVRHTCDNAKCCNPDHLEIGTQIDNINDRVSRGRSAMGERNGRSARYKLATSAEQIKLDSGQDKSQLADESVKKLGWLMGLEPTTTGITSPQRKSKVLNIKDALSSKRRKAA